MTKDEALKLALSCIKSSVEYKRGNATFIEAAEDVEQALAAPVQKGAIGAEYQKSPWDGKGISMPPPEAPVQEPVAWIHVDAYQPSNRHLEWKENCKGYEGDWVKHPLYTTPPAQPAPVQEPVAGQPLPCPFCGHIGLDFSDGETYRWGIASCGGCGASCGDVRREYPDQGEWHTEAIAEWNRRSPAAPDLQSELDATNRQVEILSDALAESRREIDAMIALARADERERIKEENQRCYAVRGNT
jgi:hypothetical protein